MEPGLQLHALQLQLQSLPIDVKRVEPLEGRRKAVRLISLRIAAERRDVERGVVEQVFQLAREFRTIFGSLLRRHASQIEIVKRFRIIARVASFQKLEDGFLRRAPAQRILCFRNRRLRRRTPASKMAAKSLDIYPLTLQENFPKFRRLDSSEPFVVSCDGGPDT